MAYPLPTTRTGLLERFENVGGTLSDQFQQFRNILPAQKVDGACIALSLLFGQRNLLGSYEEGRGSTIIELKSHTRILGSDNDIAGVQAISFFQSDNFTIRAFSPGLTLQRSDDDVCHRHMDLAIFAYKSNNIITN
ncbi:hypothetical protein TW86_00365 [Halomonas sp. S2151]|nr:hypothetical protein TW86_00365 [Halomonas sp. S2151]